MDSMVGVIRPHSTSCSTRKWRSRSASARSSAETSWIWPPATSGTNRSIELASKPSEDTASVFVPGATGNRSPQPATNAATFRWVVSTPLGVPVEPEV
jgi:hypothetical protein